MFSSSATISAVTSGKPSSWTAFAICAASTDPYRASPSLTFARIVTDASFSESASFVAASRSALRTFSCSALIFAMRRLALSVTGSASPCGTR